MNRDGLRTAIIITVLIATSLWSIPGWGAVAFSPRIGIGYESNDNIDQVPTGAVSSGAAAGSAGIMFESYANPDLFWYSGYTYSYSGYSIASYGSMVQGESSIGFSYDLTERWGLELEGRNTNYTDTALSDNNFRGQALIPELTFKLSPYVMFGARAWNTNIRYDISEELVYEHKNGGYVTMQFTDWWTMTLGGYRITAENSTVTNNYLADEGYAGMFFTLNENIGLNLSYSARTSEYYDWPSSNRTDNTNSTGLSLISSLGTDWKVILSGQNYTNVSPEDPMEYVNNIISLTLSWQPVFGSAFEDGISNEQELAYAAAMDAFEKENWGTAEKQFRKVAFVHEEDADTLFNLAYCLHRQGKYGESSGYFEKVIALDPTNEEAYSLLSYAYIKQNDTVKALRTLKELYALNNDKGTLELIKSLQE